MDNEDNPLVEDVICEYEKMAREMINDEELNNLPELQIMREMRRALLDAGMDRFQTDLYISRATILIEAEMSPSQIERLAKAAAQMAVRVYNLYKSHNFYDDAIALRGRHVEISIGEQ